MSSPGYLYLPMEIAVRELDSRLLIALMAVERGMEVIIGQKWLMETNIAAMPPGLIVFKTMTRRDSRNMARARRAGHMVASIDEEVPAFAEGSGGLQWVSEEAVRRCDRIFCLGEIHRESILARWPDLAARLIITGNPRWDYLRPDMRPLYRAHGEAYRARYGRIILINTNAGNANPSKKKPEEVFKGFVRSGELDPSSAEDMAYWNDLWNFETTNFQAIPQLARRLADAFPGHSVVIRPHPAERLDSYAEQLAGVPRVHVVFEGAAAPWIAAADVLVHTYCTTGVEAFALDTPSVCYETTPSQLHGQLLPGRLGFVVKGEAAVIAEVDRILSMPSDAPVYPDEMVQLFGRFFAARDGKLAAERVVDAAIDALGVAGRDPPKGGEPSWRPSWHYRPKWPSKAFRRRLFPAMDPADISARLQALAGALGRDSIPQFVACGDNVLHMFSPHLARPQQKSSVLARVLARLGAG